MKNMVLVAILFCARLSVAQNNSYGIYMSWQNYEEGKLSEALSCSSASDKIRLNDFFSKNYVTIIHDGKEGRFSKDSIYGYRDCKQHDFRFYYNNKEYQILENKSIVIYGADVPVTSSSGKSTVLVRSYFFSTALNGDILPLTILNLKKAFPGNVKFHDALDVTFGEGTTISAYDNDHKMYKVNYLIESLHNN